MDVITTKQATQNLAQLVEHVISDVEPTILCNENGHKAVLMGIDGESDLRRDILNGNCSIEDLLDFLAVTHPCGEEGQLYEAGFLAWWSDDAKFMHSPHVRACLKYLKEHCNFRYGKELSDFTAEEIAKWKAKPVWARPRHFEAIARLKPFRGLVGLYGVEKTK